MSERPARYTRRLIAGAMLAGLAFGLSGCGGSAVNSFDPTDWLDFLDQKKPLPGNRKPVFPEGVPGVEQGVPKELYKENVEREQQSDLAPPSAPAEPEPKAKRAKKPPAAAAAPSGADGDTAAAPPPKKQVAKRKRITTPPPDETATPQAAPEPQPQAAAPPAAPPPPQQGATAPFPAPLPSGSFSR